MDIGNSMFDVHAFFGNQDNKGSPCLNLPDIGDSFGKDMVLGYSGNYGYIFGNQGNGTVL